MRQSLRIWLILPMVLISSAAAYACPANRMVYTREGDGAVFKVQRYGKRENRWPSWFVYEGLFQGRVAYLARGSMTGGRTGISTSGFVPPAEIEQWGQDTEGFVPELFIFDGPLWGYWKGKCEAMAPKRMGQMRDQPYQRHEYGDRFRLGDLPPHVDLRRRCRRHGRSGWSCFEQSRPG